MKISGLEDDDLFLNFDADEIPKLDVIEFLKMHDGIPPVFQFNLRWTVYTFYWAHSSPGKLTNESKLKIVNIFFFQKKKIENFYDWVLQTLKVMLYH